MKTELTLLGGFIWGGFLTWGWMYVPTHSNTFWVVPVTMLTALTIILLLVFIGAAIAKLWED